MNSNDNSLKCKKCLWSDDCGAEDPKCEWYYPTDWAEAEHISEEEYEKYLEERWEAYVELADEQQ